MEESSSTRLLRQMKEICEVAGVKTEEYAKLTKKRLDVLSLTRELSREKTSLGDRVYVLSRKEDPVDILADATVKALLGRILNLEASLTDCEEEISNIRESATARASDIRRKREVSEAPGTAPEGSGAGEPSDGESPPEADAGPPAEAEAVASNDKRARTRRAPSADG